MAMGPCTLCPLLLILPLLSSLPGALADVRGPSDGAGTCKEGDEGGEGGQAEYAQARRGPALLQTRQTQQTLSEDSLEAGEDPPSPPGDGGGMALSASRLSEEEFLRHRLSMPSRSSSAALVEGHFPSMRSGLEHGWKPAKIDSKLLKNGTITDVVNPLKIKELEKSIEDLVKDRNATHHASACFEARIGLDSLGYPGLSVLLGVEGSLGADARKCLNWAFSAVLGFEYAVKVFGHGVMLRLMVKGGIKLMETPCKDGAASNFCKYLHLFLPEESGHVKDHQEHCLTNSAYEVLEAYIDSSWQATKSAFGIQDSAGRQLEAELRQAEITLAHYPAILAVAKAPRPLPALPGSAEWHVNNWRHLFNGAVKHVWFPAGARRLCLSDRRPEGVYPAGLRPARSLREECRTSLPFDEITKVEHKGNELRVSARGGRTLRLEPRSTSQKSRMLDDMRRALTDAIDAPEPPAERGVGVQCMSAALTRELKYPYCMVETFAQGFATHIAVKGSGRAMKDPAWAETFGLNIFGFEDLTVSVADVQRVGQAVGSATLRVCSSKSRVDRTEWSTISATRGCESNGNGISRIAYIKRTHGEGDCKAWCEKIPGCTAVDYYSRSRWCNFYKKPCSSPRTSHDGSRSYRMKRRKCDHVLPADGKTASGAWVTRPLVVLHEEGFFSWFTDDFAVHSAGSVKVRLELPAIQTSQAKAGSLPHLPTLRQDAQALFLAFEQWLGKVPDYAREAELSLAGTDDESAGISYRYLDGRFMARWPTWEQRRAMDGHGADAEPPKEQKSFWQNAGSAIASWFQGAGNWFQNIADHRPCVEGPLSDLMKHDHRVLDFPRALRESVSASHVGKQLDFHAEVAASLGNLFVRVVQDVHSLFGLYFASDPAWDGECASLSAWHQLPYEFGANSGVPPGDFAWKAPETRPPREARFHILRRADGVAGVRAGEMGDLSNPICAHAWVSNVRGQEQRADFLAMDAPLGGSTRRVLPQSQATKVHGHIWCNLVEHTRKAWKAGGGPAHPFKGAEYDAGLRLEFRGACHQVTHLDGGDESIWQRYECESALLSTAFITIFPTMTKWIEEQFRKVGQAVEDVLQCTGRISPSMRQFPHASHSVGGFSARDCTGKADFVQLLNEGRGLTSDGGRRWEVLSGNRACEKNPDGVRRTSFAGETSSLMECQVRCEESSHCQAVDYFRTGWCNFYSRPCRTPTAQHDGAASYVLTRATTRPSSRHAALVRYVKDRTQVALRTVSDLAKRFGTEEVRQRATKDFYDAFAYEDWGQGMGPHFTGSMYRGGLERLRGDLGSAAGLKKYLQTVKYNLIMKAWKARSGMGAVNVFPPPVRTETSVAVSFEAQWGALKSGPFMCTNQNTQQLAVEASWAFEGKTWQAPPAEGDLRFGRPCVRMRFAPVANLLMDTSLCVAQRRTRSGKYEWDFTWQLGATSILSSSPQVDLKEKLRKEVMKRLDNVEKLLGKEAGDAVPLHISEIKGMVGTAAWQVVNSTLNDPKLLEDVFKTFMSTGDLSKAFNVGGKQLLDKLKTAGVKLANTLKARLAARILEELPDIKGMIDTHVFKNSPWSLSEGQHNILSGGLTARKSGSAPWNLDFKLTFSRLKETTFSLPLPSSSSVAASFCQTDDFNVSDLLQTYDWGKLIR